MFNQLKLNDMTKQQMRAEFFRVKNEIADALVSRGFSHSDDVQFYKTIQQVWDSMNKITPKFK